MGGHMIHVEHRKRIHLVLRAAGYLTTLTVLYSPLPGFWACDAWGQQSPPQLNSPLGRKLNRESRLLPDLLLLPSQHFYSLQH